MKQLTTAMLIGFAFFACRSVNKTKSETFSSVDLVAIKKVDSAAVKRTDSVAKQSTVTIESNETENSQKDRVKIVFSDTGRATAPVKITRQPDGSTTIDAGGRVIQSVQSTVQLRESEKKVQELRQLLEVQKHTIDSLKMIKYDSSQVKQVEAVKDKNVQRTVHPLAAFAFGALSIGLLYLLARGVVWAKNRYL